MKPISQREAISALFVIALYYYLVEDREDLSSSTMHTALLMLEHPSVRSIYLRPS